MNKVAAQYPNLPGWRPFLEAIHTAKPRYIRDQLQLIQTTVNGTDEKVVVQALDFCVKHKRYSASDFSDAIEHFEQRTISTDIALDLLEIKAIDQEFSYKRMIKPVLRSLETYKLH